MTDIYIGEPREIGNLVLFTEQLAGNHELANIPTYNDVFDGWQAFVEEPNAPTQMNMALPYTRFQGGMFDGLDHPGVYAIFERSPESERQCFYVGMSAKNIAGRLRTHLKKDIKKNYRRVFRKLKKASEILVCSAVLLNNNPNNIGTIKEQLKLLESCLTVGLRPRFLTRLAGNPH